MDRMVRKKLKILIIIVLIFTLAFLILTYFEYAKKRKSDNAINYYYKIYPMLRLADILGLDIEYSDNERNKGVLESNKKNLERQVLHDIEEYISGRKKYLYKYKILENKDIQEKIINFNNNMKNIRISGIEGFSAGKTEPKTISEGEGLGEFVECRNLTDLIDYMNNTTNEGEYYIDVLDVIGVEGSDIAGRIVYKLDNGEGKVMYEKGNLGLGILFEDNSK